jgi:hypothetical protein
MPVRRRLLSRGGAAVGSPVQHLCWLLLIDHCESVGSSRLGWFMIAFDEAPDRARGAEVSAESADPTAVSPPDRSDRIRTVGVDSWYSDSSQQRNYSPTGSSAGLPGFTKQRQPRCRGRSGSTLPVPAARGPTAPRSPASLAAVASLSRRSPPSVARTAGTRHRRLARVNDRSRSWRIARDSACGRLVLLWSVLGS